MIEDMAQLHMTEAEVAKNFAAVLEKIQQGAEVIVERDAQPVAVIKLPRFRGRSIDECIALAKARGSHATLDEDFAKDLESVVASHREALFPPSWD
jgi:antitoxin (DNA-binding transcriptional repressor) of toxin-antitoxin stability system